MDNIVKLSEVKTQSEAEHIARVASELSEMAATAEMPFLKYLLDMTTEEAVQQGYISRRRTDSH